jgi:hypothetical protein
MKLIILLLSATLIGCVSLDQVIQREGEKANAPQEIIDAVKHGCASGRASAGGGERFMKDYEQYKNNIEYKMRWDDMFQLCKGRFEDSMRAIR